ncbi:unnamed protein product [Penicillium roqueforti FM164]|uniref:Genomic scaffold, ProqFM164S01 n=1 Tax=Penicillium roqueforti (strain FM164) TaxID=1365484 RepID=W6QIB5_PENRF|nr:unnamed protein product [Penicillium roqueforti FM164]
MNQPFRIPGRYVLIGNREDFDTGMSGYSISTLGRAWKWKHGYTNRHGAIEGRQATI